MTECIHILREEIYIVFKIKEDTLSHNNKKKNKYQNKYRPTLKIILPNIFFFFKFDAKWFVKGS